MYTSTTWFYLAGPMSLYIVIALFLAPGLFKFLRLNEKFMRGRGLANNIKCEKLSTRSYRWRNKCLKMAIKIRVLLEDFIEMKNVFSDLIMWDGGCWILTKLYLDKPREELPGLRCIFSRMKYSQKYLISQFGRRTFTHITRILHVYN